MEETKEMLLQQMSLLLDRAKERKDDSDDLTKLSFGISNIARAITNCGEKEELLNILNSIDGTLKHIEQSLVAEKQEEYIYNAVSRAILGEKFVPEIGDNKGNARKCYGKPTMNPEN